MTPSEIEPATLRLSARWLNQLHHYVLHVKFKCTLTTHIFSEITVNVRGNVEYESGYTFLEFRNFTI
jgi:hypothetical protein